MGLLPNSFYSAPTMSVAKKLLGTYLVHETKRGPLIGRIVETEAYLFRDDPACHAHKGMTKRNEMMFGQAGTAYIYLIYGMYYCFNVVTGKVGEGEAVLIRALEPLEGIEQMEKRRGKAALHKLCNGPGKLTMALGLDHRLNGSCLRKGPLKLFSADSFPKYLPEYTNLPIVTTTRIGITKGAELPMRFYIKDNKFISKA